MESSDNHANVPNGFTLAELLIVVAIIAVLVAIAIPMFNSQLDKSRYAVDLAAERNAKAIMSAEIMDLESVYTEGVTYYFDDSEQKIVTDPGKAYKAKSKKIGEGYLLVVKYQNGNVATGFVGGNSQGQSESEQTNPEGQVIDDSNEEEED